MHRLELPLDVRNLIDAAIAAVARDNPPDKAPVVCSGNVVPFRIARGRLR